jgi:hypothetical protein
MLVEPGGLRGFNSKLLKQGRTGSVRQGRVVATRTPTLVPAIAGRNRAATGRRSSVTLAGTIKGGNVPLITLTVQKPKTSQFKDKAFSAVHEALVSAGVPATDRFHRVLELEADDFRFDPRYPDLSRPRDSDFVLIEILLSLGRSVKVKMRIVEDVIAALTGEGFDPENIMITFVETTWENWSFGGGRFFYT